MPFCFAPQPICHAEIFILPTRMHWMRTILAPSILALTDLKNGRQRRWKWHSDAKSPCVVVVQAKMEKAFRCHQKMPVPLHWTALFPPWFWTANLLTLHTKVLSLKTCNRWIDANDVRPPFVGCKTTTKMLRHAVVTGYVQSLAIFLLQRGKRGTGTATLDES